MSAAFDQKQNQVISKRCLERFNNPKDPLGKRFCSIL